MFLNRDGLLLIMSFPVTWNILEDSLEITSGPDQAICGLVNPFYLWRLNNLEPPRVTNKNVN